MFVNSNSATDLNTATFEASRWSRPFRAPSPTNIASVGGSSSYTFSPSASGPLTVGSCAVTNGNHLYGQPRR